VIFDFDFDLKSNSISNRHCLVQALTGMNKLGRHTHNKDPTIPANCRNCNADVEDFAHLVQSCSMLELASWRTLTGMNIDETWDPGELVEFLQLETVAGLMTVRRTN
jgi:hypothetical protein